MAMVGPPGIAGMLAGPARKENGGSSHCSSHGLLAYGAGSSIVIVDVRSMQLVTVLPMPTPGNTAFVPAPFVTAIQWTPEGMQRDLTQEFSTAHLRLAVGDRQGRIAIWNVGSGEVTIWLTLEADKGRLGIQGLCWVYGHPWLLIAIHGASLLVLWDTNSGQSIWRFDAAPEVLGSLNRDPFDARQVCAVGLKGLVLSIYVGGILETDTTVKRHQLSVVEERSNNTAVGGAKGIGVLGDKDLGGKDGASLSSGGSSPTPSPALALSQGISVRCLFSSTSRGILFIMFPREIFVFDLQFGTFLSNMPLPRGCSKLLDLVAVVDGDILYCAHVDGKLSAWKRKENQQMFSLCHMDSLMPSLGTSVPVPMVLSVISSPLQILVEKIERSMGKNSSISFSHLQGFSKPSPISSSPKPTGDPGDDSASFGSTESMETSVETTFLSISDDGRLWHWTVMSTVKTMTSFLVEGFGGCPPDSRASNGSDKAGFLGREGEIRENGEPERQQIRIEKLDSNALIPTFKLMLKGQLNLLPSSISTLAVAVPSLLATSPGGGNGQAVSVPLVALATQGGTIELVDAVVNTITASFLVHNTSVRGLRWLGNSRLVSFSYTEVKGKGGGFVNHLAVTCVRSGQSKFFRVLQKPERTPMRALRTSPSGRYLLILFRESPAEVWAMTKNPQMLRSLALPFTVMEWALPPAPKASTNSQTSSSTWRRSLFNKERPTIASTVAAANAPSVVPSLPSDSSSSQTTEASQDEAAESFAFALVNGSLGVFELRGRRVRDFRPKWPSSSFVSADVLVTAMAYRMPHVVMGDRSGNIRWWDVTSGLSSLFNSHRGGVRRIKFAPVVLGDNTRGRVAVLFNDYTFAIFDLNTQDPLTNAVAQSQLGGILVSELDWFPLRFEKNDNLLLCIAGADSSFRLLEVNTTSGSRPMHGLSRTSAALERFRPMPLCSPALLPLPHGLALRMLLQLGVKPSWFSDHLTSGVEREQGGDLRQYLLETSLPVLGEVVVAELLVKVLEPYRKAGRLLDPDRTRSYAALASESCTLRFAFAAAHFGDFSEAGFWLQLPRALALLSKGSGGSAAFWDDTEKWRPRKPIDSKSSIVNEAMRATELRSVTLSSKASFSFGGSVLQNDPFLPLLRLPCQGIEIVPNEQAALAAAAYERISWHEKLEGPKAVQKRAHELISVGDFEAAVTLLLSTPPDSAHFYVDALRAVSLASAVSPALHELAVKVVAANLVATENSLSGTHLLCAVGSYQEACTQLQDTGRWVDAATLAAAHLQGTDYSRVLMRWADHVLHNERNLWRAMILYVASGALADALATLRNAKQPDTAAMFLLACHESQVFASSQRIVQHGEKAQSPVAGDQAGEELLNLPGELNHKKEDVRAVCEYYRQCQIMLAHLCTGVAPVFS